MVTIKSLTPRWWQLASLMLAWTQSMGHCNGSIQQTSRQLRQPQSLASPQGSIQRVTMDHAVPIKSTFLRSPNRKEHDATRRLQGDEDYQNNDPNNDNDPSSTTQSNNDGSNGSDETLLSMTAPENVETNAKLDNESPQDVDLDPNNNNNPEGNGGDNDGSSQVGQIEEYTGNPITETLSGEPVNQNPNENNENVNNNQGDQDPVPILYNDNAENPGQEGNGGLPPPTNDNGNGFDNIDPENGNNGGATGATPAETTTEATNDPDFLLTESPPATMTTTTIATDAPTQVTTIYEESPTNTIDQGRDNNDDLWNDDETPNDENDDDTSIEGGEEIPSTAPGKVAEELQEEERRVRFLSASGVIFAIFAMIFTAYQMSENPDGIYAAMCRFCITVFVCILRLILSPCKGLFGFSNQRHSSYYGHVPVSTMDYGYRGDPSVELQLQ